MFYDHRIKNWKIQVRFNFFCEKLNTPKYYTMDTIRDAFKLVLELLDLQDADKNALIQTCKDLYTLAPIIVYTRVYDYHAIKHLDPRNFRYISYYVRDARDLPIPKWVTHRITHVQFGDDFNDCIKHLIPDGVTHLVMGYSFNFSITNLPASVTHLTLGHMFNAHLYIRHVKHLVLGDSFNHTIIWRDIEYVKFGSGFWSTLERVTSTFFLHNFQSYRDVYEPDVPKNLKTIIFHDNYLQPIHRDFAAQVNMKYKGCMWNRGRVVVVPFATKFKH